MSLAYCIPPWDVVLLLVDQEAFQNKKTSSGRMDDWLAASFQQQA